MPTAAAMDHTSSKGAEAIRRKKQKEREQRELERQRQRLKTENANLRERVEKIASVGEEHRQKVEEMFVQRQQQEEQLRAELAQTKDETRLLKKEAAETEAQLSLSRVAKRDHEDNIRETEDAILAVTQELSKVVGELGIHTAMERRLGITSATKRDDLLHADTAIVKLEAELAEERRQHDEEQQNLAKSAEALAAAQSRNKTLQTSVAAAQRLTAQATAALQDLLASLAVAEKDARKSRDGVMPALQPPERAPSVPPPTTPPNNPPPSVCVSSTPVSPSERREKADAYMRAQAMRQDYGGGHHVAPHPPPRDPRDGSAADASP